MQVILTITDGQIMPVDSGTTANSTSVFASIRSLNTLLQIYSFDRAPSAASRLKTLACDCFGTYERIITTVKNPLWTLRSYFGILARVRLTASKNMPYWTKPYNDNGSLGKVITVVYPAFVDNYTLIGVAGVDVLLEDLGPVTLSDLTSVLLQRGNTDLLTGLLPPRLPCSVSYFPDPHVVASSRHVSAYRNMICKKDLRDECSNFSVWIINGESMPNWYSTAKCIMPCYRRERPQFPATYLQLLRILFGFGNRPKELFVTCTD